MSPDRYLEELKDRALDAYLRAHVGPDWTPARWGPTGARLLRDGPWASSWLDVLKSERRR